MSSVWTKPSSSPLSSSPSSPSSSPRKTSSINQKGRLASPTSWITTGNDSKRAPSQANGGAESKSTTPRPSARRLPVISRTEQRNTTPISMPPAGSGGAQSPNCGSKTPQTPRSCSFGDTESKVFSPDVGTPEQVDVQKSEADSLKQKQKEMQSNQMSLLSSQVHILMQITGELQKEFVALGQDMNQKFEEIRSEFGFSQDEALKMKFAWAEANDALSKTVDNCLATLGADHAAALQEHSLTHTNKLAEFKELQDAKLADLEATVQFGMEAVRSTIQEELAALQSSHEGNLMRVVEDVNSKIAKFRTPVEQMAKDVAAAQEADRVLHLELERQSNEAKEMNASSLEAQSALSKAMADGFYRLAFEHQKALEEHMSSLAKMVEEQQTSTKGHELHLVNVVQVMQDVASQVDKFKISNDQMTKDVAAAQLAFSSLKAELARHISDAKTTKADLMLAHSALSKAMDDGLNNLAAGHAQASTQSSMFAEMDKMQNERYAEDEAGRTSPGRTSPGRASPGRTSPGRTSPGITPRGSKHSSKSWYAEYEAGTPSMKDLQSAWQQELAELRFPGSDASVNEAALQWGLKDARSSWPTLEQELAELRSSADSGASLSRTWPSLSRSWPSLQSDGGASVRSASVRTTSPINKLTVSLEQMAKDLADEVNGTRMRPEPVYQSNDTANRKAGWETVQ